MLTDETRSKIETIGKIEIFINAPEEKIWKMLLIEICYISNFMTNVAVSRKFRAKEIYFDDQNMRLHANNRTLRLVHDINDHNILEHQIMKHASKKNNQILKHASNEVMKRLTSEEMQMKKIMQINNSKQTDSRVSDKMKNKKKQSLSTCQRHAIT